jgi:TetR/AcrR family transcriptional regulator, cholesterol catabolism regulator
LEKETSNIGKRRKAAKSDSRAGYQTRRKEIVEAAVRVFNRLGLKGASLSAVAAELGVDRATLYYYVSSKEQLFDEILRAVLEENDQLARRIAESRVSPARKLRELIAALMRSYAENYPLLFIYIRENLSQVSDSRSSWSNHMRNLNRSIEQSVIAIIEQGFEDGSFRRIGSARTVAYGILGMVNWSHRWFRPGGPETAVEIGNTFAEFALAGLESPYA